MYFPTIKETDVNEIHSDSTNTPTKRQRLVARWIVIDGKLSCKWKFENEH
jgi:hypothetical protein